MFSAQAPSIEPLQSCLKKDSDFQDSFVS